MSKSKGTDDAVAVLAAAEAGEPIPKTPSPRRKGETRKEARARRKAEHAARQSERDARKSKPKKPKGPRKAKPRGPSTGGPVGVPPGMEQMMSGPTGRLLCRNLYAMPWAMLAETTDTPEANPSEARIKAGGAALQTVIALYTGEWAKYLPLFTLAACIGNDGLAAYKAIEARKARDVPAPPEPVPTAETSPDE